MEEPTQPNEPGVDESSDRVSNVLVEGVMQKSFLDYAMAVIVSRALPDVRDGLKPVHRRILYSMHDSGFLHNKPFKKSARIVGDVLGRYHPHGDTAVYDSMVRMAQDFSLRYPMIDGQGNFGSVDGDNAAAMRYTEARLSKFAEQLMIDIKKNTVDFQPNFDGSLKEPIVIPSKAPSLLLNGSSGIAVGMATNIPPHNLVEVCDGITEFIDNPEITIEELNKHIKGPDFPTGAEIQGTGGIRNAYATGRGKVKVKAVMDVEEIKGKQRLIVNEIPYMVNKAMLIEQVANCVKEKKITGISDIRDESDRDGMRIVIELKKDANPTVIINQLYSYTRMRVTFGMNMVALVNNVPKTLNLKEMVHYFVEHRREVIKRRTQFDLTKAEERVHILEGLIVALDNIDQIIQKIKKSTDTAAAMSMLVADYSLTEPQSKAILEMRLQKLSSLEQDSIRAEHTSLLEVISNLKSILDSEDKVSDMIKADLAEIKDSYGDNRRTEISIGDEQDEEVDIGSLIEEEEVVVTISHRGYIKRAPLQQYKQQQRGGRGIIAAKSKDEDFIESLFTSSTHSYILFFTNKGQVYWKKVYEIPEGSRQAAGKAIINLIRIERDEKITAFVPVKEFSKDQFLVLATKRGIVKKTALSEYSRPRKGGIIAINLEDEDQLIGARITDGTRNIMISTKNGLAIRFDEKNARAIGRTSKGVKGIELKGDDEAVSMLIPDENQKILTITENGYGKRTDVEEYRIIGRAGKGVINIQCSDRNGDVVAVKAVNDADDVMFISQNGIMIRTPVQGISTIGRNTQGVRLMKLGSDDKVVASAIIVTDD
ncbi:DNA gyrase subunit A [Candidatus Woesearchaeota archaeon]|jgi:DNA gyrase subunit A|nr:DNA gyrase subunit A [Candidatus Woesearchaeota archaeon]MBT3537524.1 DNA gyrase subunit A [Candidatus Woesearchaeota archaeon]MBT4696828.1 DNA gyrase subunit A [Candidatus Woesearchaeota archaeon]MBT4717649.1 DNA gyrase subunit A [Candidatus Woesearchaeota archaeon]MBT7106166.1 DNA gyrase subunit A [Candidatus Woesearchaeota archaeon]